MSRLLQQQHGLHKVHQRTFTWLQIRVKGSGETSATTQSYLFTSMHLNYPHRNEGHRGFLFYSIFFPRKTVRFFFFFFMEFRHRRIFVWKRYQVEALQCSYAFFSGTFDRFLNKWQEKKPLKAAAGRVVIAVCVTKFKVRNLCLPVLSGMRANLFSPECGAVKIIVAPQTYKTFKVNLGKHSCVSGFSIFYSNAFLNREDIHVCIFREITTELSVCRIVLFLISEES